jgi:coenzyme Q-binding protein COQ10
VVETKSLKFMPSFRSRRFVHHTPENMFALVADVERYPEFLPFCEALTIHSRYTDEAGLLVLDARMTIGYRALCESFLTRVHLDRPRLAIAVHHKDGPFRFLENHWRFVPQDSGCLVNFSLDYAFRNPALSLLMGALFDKAFRRFSTSFEERANTLYA